MHPPPLTQKGGCSAQLGNPHAGEPPCWGWCHYTVTIQPPWVLRVAGQSVPIHSHPLSLLAGSVFSLHHFLSTCHVILSG